MLSYANCSIHCQHKMCNLHTVRGWRAPVGKFMWSFEWPYRQHDSSITWPISTLTVLCVICVVLYCIFVLMVLINHLDTLDTLDPVWSCYVKSDSHLIEMFQPNRTALYRAAWSRLTADCWARFTASPTDAITIPAWLRSLYLHVDECH